MDEKKINDKIFKLTGEVSVPITTDIHISRCYDVALRCDVRSSECKDNDDGTYNMVYKIRPVGEIVINDAGKRIPGKTKGKSQAKLTRNSIWALWHSMGEEGDFDLFYEVFQKKLRGCLGEVWEFMNKKPV